MRSIHKSALVLVGMLLIVLAFGMNIPLAHAATSVPANKSPNWAGYYVSLPNNIIDSAMMTWQVPNVDCTKNGKPISGTIGIFPGLGGVANGDLLPQLGTANQCSNGQLTTWAWWEVATTNKPQPLPNPVYVGDNMAAEVVYSGGEYQFYMNDATQGWHFQKTWTDTTTMPQSSECIVEDFNSSLLPQFTTVNITNCQWQSGSNAAQPISSGTNLTQEDVFENLGAVQMQKTQTSELGNDGASFSVDWKNYG
jgi:Peptidase A4 family